MFLGNGRFLKKCSKEVVLPFAFCLLPFALLSAAPLKSATVTEIKNDGNLAQEGAAQRAAAQKDVVTGKDRLSTGKKSRAELEFSDKSIVRLGSNTIFSFDPQSRDMKIDRGTALIHVPPGQSGARISTPAATASIMGDVVAMRVDGKGVTQIVALSKDAKGPVTVTFNKTGETRSLEPGQLLTIDPMSARMPDPVNVAVEVLMQSSGLANGFRKDLPSTARKEIKQTEMVQQKEIKNGNLEVTGKLPLNGGDPLAVVRLSSVEVAAIQNIISTSTVAGEVAGFAGNYSGGGNACGFNSITLNVQQGGGFSAVLNDPFGGVANFSGTISSSGSFSALDGITAVIDGQIDKTAGTASGTFTAPSACSGTFTLSR